MDLLRKAPKDWAKNTLNWSTEFNDLRFFSQNHRDVSRILLTELKQLVLFNPKIVIRDSDLVNNPYIQEFFLRDTNHFRDAIAHGMIVPNIRDSSECFSEVNELIGKYRAFPERHNASKPFCIEFDKFIREEQLVCMSNGIDPTDDVFRDILESSIDSNLLVPHMHDTVASAIESVDLQYGKDELLRFGKIYDFLKNTECKANSQEALRFIRTAHSLAIPKKAGISQTSSNGDLSPEHVEILFRSKVIGLEDESFILDNLPRKICPQNFLANIDFRDINEIRKIGERIGFFDSVRKVQGAHDEKSFEKIYGDYLLKLSEYLEVIGKHVKVELVDWQFDLANKIQVKRDSFVKLISWGIPIGMAGPLAYMTLSIVPIAIGSAAVLAADRVIEYIQSKRKNPVGKFVLASQSHKPE